jgi:hypothetical protein
MDMKKIIEEIVAEEEEAERLQKYGDNSLGVVLIRYCPRFFDQVGHQTWYSYIGNNIFFTYALSFYWSKTILDRPKCFGWVQIV